MGVRQRGIEWCWGERVFSQLQGAGKGAHMSGGNAVRSDLTIQKGNTSALWGLVEGRDQSGDASGTASRQEELRG